MAHGVAVWAEVVQNQVQVEAYLTDGHSLGRAQIRVIDQDGRQLMEGHLDDQGRFVFPSPDADELLIRVDLDHGHTGEYTLEIE
jgi:hypothetical protein